MNILILQLSVFFFSFGLSLLFEAVLPSDLVFNFSNFCKRNLLVLCGVSKLKISKDFQKRLKK